MYQELDVYDPQPSVRDFKFEDLFEDASVILVYPGYIGVVGVGFGVGVSFGVGVGVGVGFGVGFGVGVGVGFGFGVVGVSHVQPPLTVAKKRRLRARKKASEALLFEAIS
ncbi:hypothetical protein Tco_0448216 [Tanacetum coccineum]